jgi:hypothetical protein
MKFLVLICFVISSNINCAPQNDIADNTGIVAALDNVDVNVQDVTVNAIVDLNLLGQSQVTNQIATTAVATAPTADTAVGTATTGDTATGTATTTAIDPPSSTTAIPPLPLPAIPDPATISDLLLTNATNLNLTQPIPITNTGLDATILNDIANMFTETEAIYPSLLSGSFSSVLYTMVKDSVDSNCIMNKYNDFNAVNLINIRRLRIVNMQLRNTYSRIMLLLPNLRSLSGVIMETNDRIGRLMSMVMLSFYNAAFSCSGKLLPFLNYSFDIIMSHGNLMKSLMNDPTFEPYQRMIVCANNYANQTNILDVQNLNLPFDVIDSERENCLQFITRAREYTGSYRDSFLSFQMPPDNRACFDITFQDCENFLLRHALLTQVNMDASMLSDERANFISDFRTIMDNFFMCTTSMIINESQ